MNQLEGAALFTASEDWGCLKGFAPTIRRLEEFNFLFLLKLFFLLRLSASSAAFACSRWRRCILLLARRSFLLNFFFLNPAFVKNRVFPEPKRRPGFIK